MSKPMQWQRQQADRKRRQRENAVPQTQTDRVADLMAADTQTLPEITDSLAIASQLISTLQYVCTNEPLLRRTRMPPGFVLHGQQWTSPRSAEHMAQRLMLLPVAQQTLADICDKQWHQTQVDGVDGQQAVPLPEYELVWLKSCLQFKDLCDSVAAAAPRATPTVPPHMLIHQPLCDTVLCELVTALATCGKQQILVKWYSAPDSLHGRLACPAALTAEYAKQIAASRRTTRIGGKPTDEHDDVQTELQLADVAMLQFAESSNVSLSHCELRFTGAEHKLICSLLGSVQPGTASIAAPAQLALLIDTLLQELQELSNSWRLGMPLLPGIADDWCCPQTNGNTDGRVLLILLYVWRTVATVLQPLSALAPRSAEAAKQLHRLLFGSRLVVWTLLWESYVAPQLHFDAVCQQMIPSEHVQPLRESIYSALMPALHAACNEVQEDDMARDFVAFVCPPHTFALDTASGLHGATTVELDAAGRASGAGSGQSQLTATGAACTASNVHAAGNSQVSTHAGDSRICGDTWGRLYYNAHVRVAAVHSADALHTICTNGVHAVRLPIYAAALPDAQLSAQEREQCSPRELAQVTMQSGPMFATSREFICVRAVDTLWQRTYNGQLWSALFFYNEPLVPMAREHLLRRPAGGLLPVAYVCRVAGGWRVALADRSGISGLLPSFLEAFAVWLWQTLRQCCMATAANRQLRRTVAPAWTWGKRLRTVPEHAELTTADDWQQLQLAHDMTLLPFAKRLLAGHLPDLLAAVQTTCDSR